MAESVIIHFSSASPDEIAAVLDPTLEDGYTTISLPLNLDYLLLIYNCDEFEFEYDAQEKQAIVELFGCEPSCSFQFELRRSRQNDACDHLKWVLNHKLRSFLLVVDDSIDKLWQQGEIRNDDSEFLRGYYHHDTANE